MRRLLPLLLLLPMLTLLPGCVVARVPGPYYSEGYVAPPPVYSRPYYGRPYYGRPYGYRRRHW